MLYRKTKLRLYALAAGLALAGTYVVPLDMRMSDGHTDGTLWGTANDLASATVEFRDGLRIGAETFLGFAICETRTTFFAKWIPDWAVPDCVGVRRMHVIIQTPLNYADEVELDTIETKVRAAVANGVPDFNLKAGVERENGFATLQLPHEDGLLVVHWPSLFVSIVRVGAFIVLVVAIVKIAMARHRSMAGERCPRCDYPLPYGEDIGCPECGWGRLGGKPVMR